MLKVPLATPKDIEESVKLQRRRRFEDERMKRIFNAKQRLYGLDLVALENQIAEKKKQKHIEDECERLWEQQRESQQLVVYSKALEMEKRKKVVEADLHYYRCRFQKFEDRREFDINDPKLIKNSLPIRVADDDVRLGISSAQVFDGEDIFNRERKRRQCEQQRSWLDQQISERKQAQDSRARSDQFIRDNLNSRDKRLEEMALSDSHMNRQVVENVREFNMEMAKQKQIERAQEKREIANDDLAEIYNMMSSDMLTQNPDVADSKTNPNKKIAFMYRGMTPKELAKFREAQGRQMVDNQKKRNEQQLMDKQWEQYLINMDRELILKDNEMERKRVQVLNEQIDFNKDLAIKQKQQASELDHLMKRNHMAPEFYSQFNKSSR